MEPHKSLDPHFVMRPEVRAWLLREGNPRVWVNLLWATMLKKDGIITHRAAFSELWERALCKYTPSDWSRESLQQVGNVQLAAPILWGGRVGSDLTPLPDALQSAVNATMSGVDASAQTEFEEEWNEIVGHEAEGFAQEVQAFDALGKGSVFLAIDIANVDEKVAIELDGPTHFLWHTEERLGRGQFNVSRRANGKTAFKRRLLQAAGWTVVNISFHDNRVLDVTARKLRKEVGAVKGAFLRETLKREGLERLLRAPSLGGGLDPSLVERLLIAPSKAPSKPALPPSSSKMTGPLL